MFNFYLKRPTVEDFKYIHLVNSRLFGDKCLHEFKSQFIFEQIIKDNRSIFFTVNHGNRVAGYACAAEVLSVNFGQYAEVIDFITVEYYRNKGADVYLLGALEQWACQMLCSEIRFNADDEIKQALVKRLGYIKDENSQIYTKRL